MVDPHVGKEVVDVQVSGPQLGACRTCSRPRPGFSPSVPLPPPDRLRIRLDPFLVLCREDFKFVNLLDKT